MAQTRPVHRVAVTMNGIGVAYFMGVVNAAMATVVSFGVGMDSTQQVAVASLVNASLILAVHLAHRLGEVQAAGGSGGMSRAQTAEIVGDVTPQAPPGA